MPKPLTRALPALSTEPEGGPLLAPTASAGESPGFRALRVCRSVADMPRVPATSTADEIHPEHERTIV